jgi:hypothetical protein
MEPMEIDSYVVNQRKHYLRSDDTPPVQLCESQNWPKCRSKDAEANCSKHMKRFVGHFQGGAFFLLPRNLNPKRNC